MASIVNDVIYSYSIVHTIGGRYSEKHCKVEQIKIIAANEMFAVLDDCLFTKLEQPSKGHGNFYDTINRPTFNTSFKDWFYGTGFRYRLFSSKPRRISAIKKYIKSAIDKELSHLGEFHDLAFIASPTPTDKEGAT